MIVGSKKEEVNTKKLLKSKSNSCNLQQNLKEVSLKTKKKHDKWENIERGT